MIKFLITLLFLVTALVAKTYNFSELRYSDALERTMTLKGQISFEESALAIKYSNTNRALNYEDGELEYLEDSQIVEISEEESMKIAQYFEIILLLYSGDKDALNAAFEIKEEDGFSFLTPKGELKNHIKKIKIKRGTLRLESIKLFLSNDDTINISIENEVH